MVKELAESKLKRYQAEEKLRQYEEERRQRAKQIKDLKRQIGIKRAKECAEAVEFGFGTGTLSKYSTSEAPYGNEDTLPSLKDLEESLPTVDQCRTTLSILKI
ncbi:hypothetical protein E4U61_003059 [Claviceps capensis]|nr:hypothetical protein E4U61_003059 [Claviceps capensis]